MVNSVFIHIVLLVISRHCGLVYMHRFSLPRKSSLLHEGCSRSRFSPIIPLNIQTLLAAECLKWSAGVGLTRFFFLALFLWNAADSILVASSMWWLSSMSSWNRALSAYTTPFDKWISYVSQLWRPFCKHNPTCSRKQSRLKKFKNCCKAPFSLCTVHEWTIYPTTYRILLFLFFFFQFLPYAWLKYKWFNL